MIGNYPNDRTRTWLEGGDAALFEVTYGPNRNEDWDNDGQLTAVKDAIWYTQSLRTIRPLPSGEVRVRSEGRKLYYEAMQRRDNHAVDGYGSRA